MDEKYLSSLTSDIKLIQQDLKYIKEMFDSEKEHSQKLGKINDGKIVDHEERIRNLEKMMYKGLGAAVVLSAFFSFLISYFMGK